MLCSAAVHVAAFHVQTQAVACNNLHGSTGKKQKTEENSINAKGDTRGQLHSQQPLSGSVILAASQRSALLGPFCPEAASTHLPESHMSCSSQRLHPTACLYLGVASAGRGPPLAPWLAAHASW